MPEWPRFAVIDPLGQSSRRDRKAAKHVHLRAIVLLGSFLRRTQFVRCETCYG